MIGNKHIYLQIHPLWIPYIMINEFVFGFINIRIRWKYLCVHSKLSAEGFCLEFSSLNTLIAIKGCNEFVSYVQYK